MALKQLIGQLEQLNRSHLEMIEVAEEKKTAVIKNDIDTFISTMNRESKLLKRIQGEDERRGELAYAFMQERGIKSRLKLTIAEISRLVFDPDEKRELLDVHARLSDTLMRLKQLNDANRQLIEQALSFIDFSMELMSHRPEQEATYQHPAAQAYGYSRSGMFDRRG
ncbi:flagellar protein FlgN [Saccharibacillus alkalitolerans]|uniref:Flagellar protein FlgN n=1 Tax=Saccharibacillus alkalitolerans TaxID=2705290 RepID=A0ABX0F5A3_9BACL|nr:flagellar protein FlgN [Saccharibacillus alkalitolerans]NGZ76126.1 flagellar protein FlgN [Saccharibacillus alkalitolerans]